MNININFLTEEEKCFVEGERATPESKVLRRDRSQASQQTSLLLQSGLREHMFYIFKMQLGPRAKKREKKQCLKNENKLKQMNLTIYQVSGQTTQSNELLKHSRTQSLNCTYFVEYSLSTNR